MTHVVLFAVLLALTALDVWSTVQILNRGGAELNRPLAALMRAQGVQPALVVVKGLLVSVLLVALATGYLRDTAASLTLLAADMLFLAVVVHNFAHLKWTRDKS